jgi:hypothetical protein
MFIPDPDFFHPGSGSATLIKNEEKYRKTEEREEGRG